jgi:hypothetical protein
MQLGWGRELPVFDTCNVVKGKAYGLDFHLDRLLRSAELARIKPRIDKEGMRQIILATIATAGMRDQIYVRYWLTAGKEDRDQGSRKIALWQVGHKEGFYLATGRSRRFPGNLQKHNGFELLRGCAQDEGQGRLQDPGRARAHGDRAAEAAPPGDHQEQQLPPQRAHVRGVGGQGGLPRHPARR